MKVSGISGQKEAREIIQGQLEQERVSHAYLFLGREGLGKKALAVELARSVLCSCGEEENCGCTCCKKIDHGNHPDLRIFRRTENRRELGIDIIREMQRRLAFRPYEGQRRFFIIAEADRMTRQAANSLLKTLESPPDYATLILLAEEEELLLPTILSRCQQIRLKPIPKSRIAEELKSLDLTEEKASLIAGLSGGSPGRARKLAEDESLLERRKEILNFLSRPEEFNYFNIFQRSKKWLDWFKEDFPLADLLMDWQRDIMIVEQAGKENLSNFDYYSEIKAVRQRLSAGQAVQALELAAGAAQDLENNVRSDLVLQVLMIKLKTLYSG